MFARKLTFLNINLLIKIVFFTPSLFIAQMLDNRDGNAFTEHPFFNVEFIKQNKIKTISGSYTYKKPGETIKNTGFKQWYQFDSLGRLIYSYETRKDDGSKDTTKNRYVYASDGRIMIHKKGDGKGYSSSQYSFDEKGRLIKETFFREYIDSFGIQKQTLINAESTRYEITDSIVKKTVYNNYDLPYMQVFTYFDTAGYVLKREERMLMTSDLTTYKYAYNDHGLLASIKQLIQNQETPNEEQLFIYDSHGNLIEKQYYRKGIYITETEMIYNEKSKLLTYVLTREVATNTIVILSFKTYTFY
jgi:hypothetical protein